MYSKQKKILIKKMIIVFLSTLLCFGCTQKSSTNIIMDIEKLHNSDAKFFNDNIITTIDSKLVLLDLEGNLICKSDIDANWVNCIAKEDLIIYSNGQNLTGIAYVDNNNQLIPYKNIIKSDNLQIDPAIINVNGTYFATMTEIEGNVNNENPETENGIYTIHLYKSENLSDWTFVSDIVREQRNLEDVDLFFDNNSLYIIYERERTDKGESEICMSKSTDSSGTVWDKPKTLIPSDCDHEPATIIKTKNGYNIFYSCDKNNPKQSYMGAEIFYAEFDRNFNIINKDIKISTETLTGILLYDVMLKDNKYYFLFAENYLTDCNLKIESGIVYRKFL